MVRQVQDQDMKIAIRDLKTYARKDRGTEIEEQTIKDINSLPEQDALWYIRNLRDKPRQVRATGKNQMDVSGVVITMDTLDRCKGLSAADADGVRPKGLTWTSPTARGRR